MDVPGLGEGVPMLAQLAMLALSILAIVAAFLAIRSDGSRSGGSRSDGLERSGTEEEVAPGSGRRWTRVPGKRRR